MNSYPNVRAHRSPISSVFLNTFSKISQEDFSTEVKRMPDQILGLDLDTARREILRALRGQRSQETISTILGYQHNQVYKWESGTKRMLWPDFILFCDACGANISAAFNNAYHRYDIAASKILDQIIADVGEVEVMNCLGVSIHTVRRWLSGKTAPSFDQVFLLLDRYTQSLSEFLNVLVPLPPLSALRKVIESISAERRFHYDFPIVAAIVRCFELDAYKKFGTHQRGFVARTLGISVQEEESLLERAEAIGVIKKENDLYKVNSKKLRINGPWREERDLKLYWHKKGIQCFELMPERPDDTQWLSYMVFSANEEIIKKIRQRYIDFYQEVLSILSSEEEKGSQLDCLRALSFQLFNPFDKSI